MKISVMKKAPGSFTVREPTNYF